MGSSRFGVEVAPAAPGYGGGAGFGARDDISADIGRFHASSIEGSGRRLWDSLYVFVYLCNDLILFYRRSPAVGHLQVMKWTRQTSCFTKQTNAWKKN